MELNPNHPVSRAMHEQWAKIAALLVAKEGGHVVITEEDIIKNGAGMYLTIEEKPDGIHLRLVDSLTAARLARENGGLPQ